MNKIRQDLISALILAGADRHTVELASDPNVPIGHLITAYMLQKQITKITNQNEEIKIQLAQRSRQQ